MKKKRIRAAGGIVERKKGGKRHIAVVHRTRRRDRKRGTGHWVLPKGKPDSGESIKETALREVEEETGCAAKLTGGKKKIEYKTQNNNRKAVTFFRMKFVKKVGPPDASEISKVKWLRPRAVLKRLTYNTERRLLLEMYPNAKKK